ncbi:MAG: hypothetical protein WD182_00910 [Bacteroidota bacterium]
MEIRTETRQFLRELELHAGKKLSYPDEVAYLVDLARGVGRLELLEDAIFHAKFVTKSYGVMKRIGADGEGYGKMSGEFQASLEKVSTLLRTLVKESPDELKGKFVRSFFSLDHDSMSRLMSLLHDLTALKNWRVDGKPLP